ncbi:MAG: BTAD domain-containing putative transcriptional regulator [Kiloniellales bacterium]|nr:BTAD domain-containing putative transcriptional regulator [Kiloniellales bacterium]
MRDEPSLPVLKISLLGGFEVQSPTGDSIQLSGQKDRALLGFLAVSPGVAFAREKLAALLWSESGDKQARDSLKQAVLRLRRCLEPLTVEPLITTRQTVTLKRDAVWVDTGRFESLLSEPGAESIEQAASLYRGDLLDGLQVRDASFEDWLQVERVRLRGLATEALTRLMAQALDAGQRESAIGAARRLLSLDPLQEAACRTLMRVHAERGERPQALKLFDSLRGRLSRELAVTPEPETLALYQSIRNRRADEAPREAERYGDPQKSDSDAAADRFPREGPDKPSIAVLPFANIGKGPEQDYLADGLTEDIITDLSRVSGLFVASRHSAFVFKGKAVAVQEAAGELRVGHILEGSVRAAAGRVRITTQLVDGATGGQIWAARYDRSLEDIFALQDEIAESIVQALKVKLLPEELAVITSHATKNVDAYQYYLMGRSFYLRGLETHGLRIARKMFAKAVELDPRYARAFAALAACEAYLSMSDPAVAYESSVANSLRALELDPNLAEARAVRGLVLFADGRFAEATSEFERALSLAPDLHEAHFFYALNCRLQGRHEKAAALFERAAALRPNDYRSAGLLASEYRFLNRREDSDSAARRCLERVEAAIETHPDNAGALAFGSALLARLGQRTRAKDWATRAIMIGPDDSLAHYNVTRTHALLGEATTAMDRLEQAFRSTPEWQRHLAQWMAQDDDIDPLRAHPRFKALLDRLDVERGARLRAAAFARLPKAPPRARARPASG